jgi:co-chaperonin GroES (HSP10)
MAAVGLHAVVLDENVPRPTEGRVEAIGDDPFMQERLKIGDTVTFAKHAGIDQLVEGRTYRVLTHNDIISVIRPDEPEPKGMVRHQIEPPTELVKDIPDSEKPYHGLFPPSFNVTGHKS